MNNLSSALVSTPSPSITQIDSAARWSRQSLTVANGVRKDKEAKKVSADDDDSECEMVALVGAFNLGKLCELQGDKSSAKKWFEKSLRQGTRLGSVEGVERCKEALRRL